MTIDEQALAGADSESADRHPDQHVSPPSFASAPSRQSPSAISTQPPTMRGLDALERELGITSSDRRADLLPPTVEQWPGWLQRQWITAQRRRAWQVAHPSSARRLFSPAGILVLSLILVIALGSFGLGATLNNRSAASGSPATNGSSGDTSGMGMAMGSTNNQAAANVPDATQPSGNQPAKYVMDKDGVKHFTLTAQQVMWQPIKGHKVLAWTLDGTVPGPMIQATAGEHLRITIVNHLPEATAIHWHGLEVPTDNDGVPPVGMKPIEPGKSYTYDFTLRDADAGTHWYHSHYDDLKQVAGGMYGAFIVAPRPGSPEYQPMMLAQKADVDQTMFFGMLGGYYVINGKSFPETQPITVKHGQTVHLRLIGADTSMIHPMHLHGHSFTVFAEDGHLLPAPYLKDTLDVSPGETFDVSFYAWAAPGSVYPFHCHILSHLMNPGQTGGEMGGLITLLEYQK